MVPRLLVNGKRAPRTMETPSDTLCWIASIPLIVQSSRTICLFLRPLFLPIGMLKLKGMLELSEYREPIQLDVPFVRPQPLPTGDVDAAVSTLLSLLPRSGRGPLPLRRQSLSPRDVLYSILIARDPIPFPPQVYPLLDRLLALESVQRLQTSQSLLPLGVSLWKGDIAELAVDGIVNAANDALLGCFRPFHACIDNRIHAVAGPMLRADCQQIMMRQGHPEPTGVAKITRAYHLPSRYVLHTVGPIVQGNGVAVSDNQCRELSQCYRACLDLAAQVADIRSLAFCCISTGAFGFPQQPAAQIAMDAVGKWLSENPTRFDRIVFNVFTETDHVLYRALLSQTPL